MRSSRLLTALLLAGSMIAGPAMARYHHHVAVNPATSANMANANAMTTNVENTNNSNNLANADALMQNSQGVVSQMQSDTNVANLMRDAKGVFIIPNSSNASANGGASPAGGVLMTKKNGRWSDPVFFSVGGATATQPGTSNGTVALLIMSNRALNEIRSGGNIALNGKRLHVIDYSTSANTQPSSLQRSDLILWSGSTATNMLPSLTVRANKAYDQTVYGTNNPGRIAAGRAPLTNQLAANLANQMPQGQAPTQLGSNQTGTMPQTRTRRG